MGRTPTPTRLKVLMGNPGHRPLNRREPEPEPGRPSCPSWLTGEAKREWKRIVPELDRLGLLTRIDRAALAGYCQCWARWKAAEEAIEKHGAVMTMRDDKGNVKWVQPVPEVGIAVKMLDRMRAFASEFGLSPSARTRLQIPAEPAGKHDDGVQYLNGNWHRGADWRKSEAATVPKAAGTSSDVQ